MPLAPATLDDLGAMYEADRHKMIRFLTSRFGRKSRLALECGDVLHEGLVLALRHLHTFDGTASLTTWCNTIAMRRGSDIREREAKRTAKERRAAVTEATNYPCDVEASELEHVVQSALRRLNQRHRITLTETMNGKTCGEIAAKNGWTIPCVRNYLHLARVRMRELLTRAGVM